MPPRVKRDLFEDYRRVTPDCPCPICGRPDWCLIHNMGMAAICSRQKSSQKRGKAGWYHKVDKKRVKKLPPKTAKIYLSQQQINSYLASISHGTNANMLERQARMMGLSLESLIAFGALYDHDKAVVAFPMLDAIRRVVGVRFRRSDGRKWALKGGREGVFISKDFRADRPVIITEGPSDGATIWEAGLPNVLARPSCMGGAQIIRQLLQGHRYTPVVIVADPDEPGLNGASDLANLLINPTIVVTGPTDVRDYHVKSQNLASKLTMPLRACIVKSLTTEEDEWHTTYRNSMGRLHDFTKGF